MTMERKLCNNCGVTCWHNPCASSERSNGRCTYCGYPPGGNATSMKREIQRFIMDRQVNRARLLGLTER